MERFEHGGDVYGHPGALDFSASLNPLGMPPAARDALVNCVDACEAYPDPACRELTRAIAGFEDVPEGWVLACAGATDAFFRMCLALRPRRALVCAPCYAGYEEALAQVGCSVVLHGLDEGTGFDVTERIAEAICPGVDVVFLANPNNPTGRCLARDVLEACLVRAREAGALVVLDECFVDVAEGAGSTDLVARHDNLVLVKALTKSFALAGLRVGYALCSNAELLARFRAAGQPWAVSVPAQAAGIACLRDAGSYLAQSRALIARERASLRRALEAQGFVVVPSEANYLLFRAPRDLSAALLARGVLVRSCANFVGLDARWHRIAVRTPEENAAFVRTLGEVCA